MKRAVIRAACLAILAFPAGLATHAAAQDGPPRRVVSMNLCTDEMAMLIAAPGQLHSVSYLAADAGSSALASEAGGYAVNHGLAEEIFLMQPDMVLAGTYTTRATVGLLRKLGIRVEEFEPENSFDDIRANLKRMGDLLGQPERAASLAAELDSELAALKPGEGPQKTVAAWYANSYTSGSGTLMDDIIRKSGLDNIAARLGYTGTARLPLEFLVLAKPDMLADGGSGEKGAALAEENFVHPAYRALARESIHTDIPAKYTICGAPFTAEAVRLLRQAAERPKPQ